MKERPNSSSGRSVESIKAITQRFDLEVVFKLSLTSKGLTAISCLEGCINLVDLDLSNNAISKIEGLDTLVELRRLNLSSNKISKVDNLWGLKKLEALRLQNNQISLDGLNLTGLAQLTCLKTLYLQNIDRSMQNPACKQRTYKDTVLAKLGTLTNLDGIRSPAAISYFDIAAEAEELAARPPLPQDIQIPDLEPWLQGSETSSAPSAFVMDPEFKTKAESLVRSLDDCHTLAEVLKEELGKFQRQLLSGASQGS